MSLNQDLKLSFTEENYLKAIYKIGAENDSFEAGTNELASELEIKPASVNEMLKRLRDKELVTYKKYEKTKLTPLGRDIAKHIIRKHRLWETFLFDKLGFGWDEVHEIAEEMEHIKSKKLIDKLDTFLGSPKFDPHGEPIPDQYGDIATHTKSILSNVPINNTYKFVAVKDDSKEFLQYVSSLGLKINDEIEVIDRQNFDGLTTIKTNNQVKMVTEKFADNIYVIPAQ